MAPGRGEPRRRCVPAVSPVRDPTMDEPTRGSGTPPTAKRGIRELAEAASAKPPSVSRVAVLSPPLAVAPPADGSSLGMRLSGEFHSRTSLCPGVRLRHSALHRIARRGGDARRPRRDRAADRPAHAYGTGTRSALL